jgi:branched-chain amino acid transport system substrate-binding protein
VSNPQLRPAAAQARPRWRRATVLAALVISACTAAAACGGGTGAGGSSSAGSPISIGYILPLTGFLANNAKAEEEGFKLGLKTYGSTINGHPIHVTYLDSQGQPSVALTDATQLIQREHVVAVEGPLVSSSIAASAPYVMAHGAVEDDLYLASPQQMNDYKKYGLGFTSGWTGYQPPTAGADWAYRTQGWRHATVVANDFSFGWRPRPAGWCMR